MPPSGWPGQQAPGQQGPGQQRPQGPGQQGPRPPAPPWATPPGQQGPGQQGWAPREDTRQFGAVPPQSGQPGGSSSSAAGGWSPQGGQPAPWTAQPATRSSRKPLVIGGAVLLVALLVAGGLFFFLRGGDFTYAGRTVTEPEKVLTDGESAIDAYVSSRNGASSDDTACFYRYLDADTTDVQDDLVCGPVLFVDGDTEAQYLQLPVTPSAGSGDVTLEVAAEPSDPEPQPIGDRELLSRPDGSSPPDGAGGLEVPEPQRAEPGYTAEGPFDDVTLEAPSGPAVLAGPAARVTVTEVGETDRVGTGDDARRPAEGEVFRVFGYQLDSGIGLSNTAPSLAYRVDGGDEVPVDSALVSPGASIEGLLSVPEGATLDLVVTDGDVVQTLSLVDGTPGPDNLQVLVRENTEAAPVPAQQIPGVISAPGRVTTPFTFTVTVQSAELSYYAGTNVTALPSGPDRAFLVLDTDLVADGLSGGEGPAEYFTLTLPDGTVVPSQDLVPDPSLVGTAFDVPADFTEGTLTFGGVFTYPDTATVDFQPNTLSFAVSVPAG
ncbi:hypothetical protein F1C76_06710 [Geodermatophilaceae bacterium NBWT11]|nr:hypothetical protein F1C76_06710 [Geodermatophilaceae bacterium NBWT11]